jgi:hypothetical protein
MNGQIADLETLVTGIKGKLKSIKDQRNLFNKAKGLLEEEEKLRAEVVKYDNDIKSEKENKASLQEKKNKAMQGVVGAMAAKMNEILPVGKAEIRIDDDGGIFIGLKKSEKITVPYAGLSGGEKASFDPALCRALGGTVLIIEAAELDSTRLTQTLERYAETDLQVIVSS